MILAFLTMSLVGEKMRSSVRIVSVFSKRLLLIKRPFWRPIPFKDWEERKLLIGRNPLRGAVFEWERLNPTAFAGNGGLDKVRKRFNVASTGLTLVHLFNLQP